MYHGSSVSDISELKPQKGYTPDDKDVDRSFTSDLPAFAAAQGFSWATDEGFKLEVDNEKVTFKVPAKFKQRLMQKLYLYTVPSDNFDLTNTEDTGHTYDAKIETKISDVQEFNSVQEAVEHFGGKVIYYAR